MTPLAYFLGLGSGVILGAFALLLIQLWQNERAEKARRLGYAARATRCLKAAERALAVRAARARLGRVDPFKIEPGNWFLSDLLDDDDEGQESFDS